jgi:outer membrane scaffolding protein for murein synthesis (MipA/OmpV family)
MGRFYGETLAAVITRVSRSDRAAESPLVRERNQWSSGIGLGYRL